MTPKEDPRGNNGCVFVSLLRGGNDDRGERTQQNAIKQQQKREYCRDEQDSFRSKRIPEGYIESRKGEAV